jgi:hypothetical protein
MSIVQRGLIGPTACVDHSGWSKATVDGPTLLASPLSFRFFLVEEFR